MFEGAPTLAASWQAAFNSASSVGQFFGGFFCSWLADRLGRKPALLVGLILATGGIFGEVFANTNVEFLIGKLILGIGLGFYLTVGPLYCSEVSPVVFRGITTAGINFAIVIGQLLSNAAIKGFGARTDSWAYRGPFMIQLLFVGKLLRITRAEYFLNSIDSIVGSRIAFRSRIAMVLCTQRAIG
jgi:MFS family permease